MPVADQYGPRGNACDVAPDLPDSDMRRDGPMLPPCSPNHPVDERGRVHCVPDLDHFAASEETPWETMCFTVMKEKK